MAQLEGSGIDDVVTSTPIVSPPPKKLKGGEGKLNSMVWLSNEIFDGE
jgi:hypothetical protein